MAPLSDLMTKIGRLKSKIAADEFKLRLEQLASRTASESRFLRIKSNVAFRRFQLALARHEAIRRKASFNPDQPRVAAGNPDGGRWTSDGGLGVGTARRETIRDPSGGEPWEAVTNSYRPDRSIARQTIVNRDGSAIRSDFSLSNAATGWDERHAVVLPDGGITVFETLGLNQTIRDGNGNVVSSATWTASGPEPDATVQPVFLDTTPRPGILGVLGAAATLYTWMSSSNSADERAVFALRADQYRPGADVEASAVWVGRVTQDQVEEACPRYPEVQSITNQSAEAINRGDYGSAAQYGTAVHTWIRDEINGPPTFPASPPRDPNFRAERSFIKSDDARYGKEDSIRIDVFENPGTGTVCVYDVKTGQSGLSAGRTLELASAVQFYYPGTQQIIVTEVRPQR